MFRFWHVAANTPHFQPYIHGEGNSTHDLIFIGFHVLRLHVIQIRVFLAAGISAPKQAPAACAAALQVI
jgi:hypothetical protein